MATLGPHVAAMPQSGIRLMMEAVRSHPGPMIGLHVGEPCWPTPQHVVNAMRAELERGGGYAPSGGRPDLREAIAARTIKTGRLISAEQVVVTAGGTQAVSLALSAVLRAGDEVLLPDPGWPNYAMAVRMLQGHEIRYPLRPSNGFLPDMAEIRAMVTARTRAIIVNTPSNPLGTVWPGEIVTDLLDLANEHDVWVLSDECYQDFVHEGGHVSPASVGAPRVMTCHSFSKSYAMTGQRVGYLVAPPRIAPACVRLQEALLGCVNGPAQLGALAALNGSQAELAAAVAGVRRGRDAAVDLLRRRRVRHASPAGAFYLWLEMPCPAHRADEPADDTAWAVRLLEERSVAVVPGTAFGPGGEGWARVSLAVDETLMIEGLSRILDAGQAA